MTASRSVLLKSLAAAGAFCLLLLASAPAEAITCPAGYRKCPGGKALMPKPCCPIKKAAPAPTSTFSGRRCLSAVRDPGPGGSVKIKCVRWAN